MTTSSSRYTPVDRDRPNHRGLFSRYAWHFHGRAALLLGVWGGVAVHSEYILLTILGGDPSHVATLMALGTAGLLTGLFSGPMMQGREKRPFFLIIGAGGRVGLLVMAFADEPTLYLVGFGLFALTDAFLIPALTAFYQANYPARSRSHYFGRFTRRGVSTLILVSIIAGWWLEADREAYRWLLIIAAVAGAVGWWQLARVRFRGSKRKNRTNGVRGTNGANGARIGVLPDSIAEATEHGASGAPLAAINTRGSRNPFRAMYRLFARDLRFFRFEMQFMLYGMAFMMVNAIIPAYLTTEYRITFDQIAWARGLIFHGMLALGVPLVARFLGSRSPMTVCVFAFCGLGLTQVLIFLSPVIDRSLAATPGFEGLYEVSGGVLFLYLAFMLYGLSMSGVHVVWNLASIYFAGDDEPTHYQGAHTLMVGIRGAIMPFVGVWIAATFSPGAAFITAACLFVLGALSMGLMARSERRAAASQLAVAAA